MLLTLTFNSKLNSPLKIIPISKSEQLMIALEEHISPLDEFNSTILSRHVEARFIFNYLLKKIKMKNMNNLIY